MEQRNNDANSLEALWQEHRALQTEVRALKAELASVKQLQQQPQQQQQQLRGGAAASGPAPKPVPPPTTATGGLAPIPPPPPVGGAGGSSNNGSGGGGGDTVTGGSGDGDVQFHVTKPPKTFVDTVVEWARGLEGSSAITTSVGHLEFERGSRWRIRRELSVPRPKRKAGEEEKDDADEERKELVSIGNWMARRKRAITCVMRLHGLDARRVRHLMAVDPTAEEHRQIWAELEETARLVDQRCDGVWKRGYIAPVGDHVLEDSAPYFRNAKLKTSVKKAGPEVDLDVQADSVSKAELWEKLASFISEKLATNRTPKRAREA